MAKLLVFKHSIEGGEPVEAEVEAWFMVVGDFTYADALAAARDHYRDAPLDDRGRAPSLKPRHIVEACAEPVRSASWVGNVTEQRLAAERLAVES